MIKIQDSLSLRLCLIQSKPSRFGSRRLHSHPFHEIGFVLRGECVWHQKGRRSVKLAAGQAVWVPPDHLHREESGQPVQLAWIGFASKAPAPSPTLRPIPFAEHLETVFTLMRQIEREQHQSEADSAEICALALRQIILMIRRSTQQRMPSRVASHLLNARQVQIVRSVAAHLDQNRERPLTLEQVAHYHNLSPPHLSVLFKKHYRMTPTSYRLHGRLAQAKALLENPKLSVKEIASACGFTDAAHFCREFKRLTGKTPGLSR